MMLGNIILFGITFYTSYQDNLGGVANIASSMIGRDFMNSFLGAFGGSFIVNLLHKRSGDSSSGMMEIQYNKLKKWAIVGLYAGLASVLSGLALSTFNIPNVRLFSALLAAFAANYSYFGRFGPVAIDLLPDS